MHAGTPTHPHTHHDVAEGLLASARVVVSQDVDVQGGEVLEAADRLHVVPRRQRLELLAELPGDGGGVLVSDGFGLTTRQINCKAPPTQKA